MLEAENEDGEIIDSVIDYNDLQWYDDALLINVDPNRYGGISSESAEVAEASAKAIVQKYFGHKITDVMYCVFEQTSILSSVV